jgi:leucyl-tRNA synthetase
MPLVERWGADSMRLTMLFASPFEDDIDWKLIAGDPDRRPGVHHWLGRVFAAVGEAAERAARGAAEALTQMLAPFAPFAAEELWRVVLGHDGSVHVSRWPSYDEALAAEVTVTLVVQVDGKVRDKLEVGAGTDEARTLELARASENARRAIADREVVKEIVRPPRLVNFVTR